MTATPLLQRTTSAPVAWLTQALPGLAVSDAGLGVSESTFIHHVKRVADALPAHQHAINLCDNRYLFMVCLCASILRGATNLLAPNKNLATQQDLATRYPNSIVVHDQSCPIIDQVADWNALSIDWALQQSAVAMPNVELAHLAVISFTSGSTGQSKANLKTWHTMQASSKINARYMLADEQRCFYHLATVPGQHMWGFETSVMLAMFANACLVDARPLYPADIISCLHTLPEPRCLISTPVHLRALCTTTSSKAALPALTNLLCATAPLAPELAAQLEQMFASELREVYGCSEVGSMAVRRASRASTWHPFDGLQFDFAHAEQSGTVVSADHLPQAIRLEDQLKPVAGGRFELTGRQSDQIKIAGKRGSLAEANKVLLDCAGVIDGVVIFPEQDRAIPRLVALVKAEPALDKVELRRHFAKYLDAAFIPRPIYLVEQLPREDNGKLSKAKVLALYQSLQA